MKQQARAFNAAFTRPGLTAMPAAANQRGSGGDHHPRIAKKSLKEIDRMTRRQEETSGAVNSRWPYSAEEDRWLLVMQGRLTIAQMAVRLGRTFYATRARLRQLNREERMGTALKHYLREQRIGLREFAREIGVPAANLSNIVNHGSFTAKDKQSGIKNRIREALLKRGISDPKLFDPRENRGGLDDEPGWEAEMIEHSAMEHFNLKSDPFDLNAVKSPQDIYWTEAHQAMKKALERAIVRKDFIAVAGEVGAGKSLVYQAVEHALDDKTRVIFPRTLSKEKMTAFHLQEAIIADLKAGQQDYSKPTRSSLEARDRQIIELLRLYHSEGITCALVIEEAHALGIQLLRTLKRLYELKAGFEALCGIILIGQPELEKFWQDLRVREFNRRCRLIRLPSLRAAEIPAYIRHKFTRSGENVDKVFEGDALKAVGERLKSGGERLKSGAPALQVNNLCARAVNRAADAKLKKISAAFVYELD